MSRPMVQVRNTSKWDVNDIPSTIHARSNTLGVGVGVVSDASAPITCDATQVALIDEVMLACLTKDSAANTTITLQVNGRTSGVHGATSTRAPDPLPFHFPGDTNIVRMDRYTIRPRGKMVVHPSSTLWVQASDAGVASCHIRYRKKSLLAALRDGDISPNGSLPQVASTNSVTTGGIAGGASKLIAFCGTQMVSGTADSGTNATVVDAERTEATDVFTGKRIRFTNSANNGQIRAITSFNPSTDTITFAPVISTPVAVGDTYEILNNDEAIEILGMYLTGHNFQAAATDDHRIGFWSGGGTNFTTDGKMFFRGYVRGLSTRYGMRVLLDNVDRCIGGALGSDVWVQATTNLAGATPKADYNIIYRKVQQLEMSDTNGAALQTPASRGRWWCFTETDPTFGGGFEYVKFFNATFAANAGLNMVRLKGQAGSVVSAGGAGQALLAIGISPGDNAIFPPEFVTDDGNLASIATSWGHDGINQDIALTAEPGFIGVDLTNVVTSRAQLAWGTFGVSPVSGVLPGSIV